MRGLEITFRGETITVSPENHAGVFMYQRYGDFHIGISGLEENEKDIISHIWIDSRMEIGETIEIELKDVRKFSEPVIKKIAFSDPVIVDDKELEVIKAERTEHFYELEKILKEEGLI
jgi:hypothetical protein